MRNGAAVAFCFVVGVAGCEKSNETQATNAEPAAVTPAPPPAPDQISLAPLAERLVLKSADLGDTWVAKGYHDSVGALEGETWGSFNDKGDPAAGGNAAIGIAQLTFEVPVGVQRIALPVATGPGEGGRKIQVLSGADETSLVAVDIVPVTNRWVPIDVAVPAGVTSIVVHVEDSGSEWGQWLAVGAPYQVTN